MSLSGCGNSGCRTPEETILGGFWESTQFTKVKPINPNVIKQENQFGAYVLHDGTTEAMAKENLWFELKTPLNNDVIIKSGNKFTMEVSDSVILAGTSQILNVKLNDYVKLNSSLTSGSEIKKTENTVTSKQPSKITQIIKYKTDGTHEYEYKYEVNDDNGAKIELTSEQITNMSSSCKPTQAPERINYIWYFPKKIIFHKWIDENYNIVNKIVTVDVDHNNLSCKVQSKNGILWYVCTFDYNEEKLQYKRRVTPIIIENYPQFEEQVSKTDEEIMQLLIAKSKAKDSSISGPIDECFNKDKMPDEECLKRILEQQENEQEKSIQLTDEEYKQNYYMCIFGGKTDNNDGSVCSEYKFSTIGTEDDKITPKSPIMVIFKTYNEIYGSGRNNTYNNRECFQQGEYKNRFIPLSSLTTCKETSKQQQFCRMAPRNIEYNLHKIKKDNYDWLDYDASEKEINYCTNLCPRKDDYNLDESTGECPKDCAVQLYKDDGEAKKISSTLSNPSVISCVDYQHRRRKEADLRAGAKYDDSNNTMYYAIDENLLDADRIDYVKPNNMLWKQVRLPCIMETNTNDAPGYRRVETTKLTCCNDFTNSTKVESKEQGTGYFMCDDVSYGKDCRTSLITSNICNPSMIAQGNCYHIETPNYKTNDNWHSFCDGYNNDLAIISDIKFTKAEVFDATKPAYLANVDAIQKYMGGSIYIPKIYPANNIKNVGLDYGLLPVASDDVVSIECVDEAFPNLQIFEDTIIYTKKPDGYDDLEEKSKKQFKIVPDDCRIDGKYYTYKSSNELFFNKNDNGIIPIQWFPFSVKAGQTIPITISSQYPILIKSGDQYIEMRNGNGLMVYIDPDEEEDSNGSLYSDPEMWQCNMGLGGSYGYYRPYEYSKHAVYSKTRNPRKIATPNELWWYCDNERPMWFSGYDFKNIKTGKPVYMHTYDTQDVVKFLPKYNSDGEIIPPEESSVEKVGCNEDSLPKSMIINGKFYDHTSITGLLYDERYGPQYVYSENNTQQTIPVSDVSITNKTYEKYEPKIIVVDLPEEGLTNVQIQADTKDKKYNGLVRTYKKNGNNILQAYYEFDYFSKHYKIRIEDSIVHKPAICYNEGEAKQADTLSDDEVLEITNINFVNDSKYYVLNKTENSSEIFTRFGPFSGMHINTSGLLLPAIYTTEGACLDHFIYDEQHKDSPEGYKEMSTWYGVEDTHILRKNLSKPWRVEFTTPSFEYNDGKYLIEEKQDNSTGTLSSCYNKVNFESCGPTDVPDIILVDLSKTNNAKKKTVSGSVVLYKDENFIQYTPKYYYVVTFPPLGWNEYHLNKNDPIISSINCGDYSNCNDETPVIEVTVNGIQYRIEDGDIINDSIVKVSKIKQKSTLSFDIITNGANYNAGNYTIEDPILDKNAICFTSSKICKSYLDKYIGIDSITDSSEICENKSCKTKDEYLFSLSKAPYIVACQNDKTLDANDKTETTSIYSQPYETGKVYPELSSNETGGFVLKTNIHSFVNNQYFARCVPSWITPKWMIMEQPNDPSTFYTGNSAISGTYIAPSDTNWNIDNVKDKYHLNSVWRSYGGIVKNTVINQKCDTGTLSDGTKYKINCELKNVDTFNANFIARYPKQLIMVKPIVNDPINTSDDECQISITGDKNASTKIKMNSPFGFSSSIVNSYSLDKKEAENNIPGVQANETVNGDGKHGEEFFKQSEFQRNMIGAGILTPSWNTLSLSNGSSAVFNKGDKINFNTIGNYYVSGALSHKSQAYCMIRTTWAEVGAISMYTLALEHELAAGVALSIAIMDTKAAIAAGIIGAWPLLAKAAALYATSAALQAASIGFIVAGTEISKAPSGIMETEKASGAKRSCGIATAFKVVPIPPAACLKGYLIKCNNDRINDYIGSGMNEKTLLYCKSEESVDFRTNRMKIGACNKNVKNIDNKSFIEKRPQRYKSSDAKYPNTLVDAVGKWSDLENIYEENCGVCVKKKTIYSHNGIVYSVDDLTTMSKMVRTSEHCKNYIDDDGNTYTWTQNIKIIKPFDNYTYSNKKIVFDSINDILSKKISACEPDNNYSISFDDKNVMNNFKIAFLKMQIRDVDSCISNMATIYSYGLSSSGTTDECKNKISDDLENMAKASCNEILAISKSIDGNEYYDYIFSQNATSAICQDDKYNRTVSTNDNQFGSVTRFDANNILSEYGYGELTTDNSSTSNVTTNINLQIPTTIKGKSFKTAKLGFFLAGEDSDDPLRLYRNYRIINQDDLQRGYTLSVGNGAQISKGKYLYYYIQPLNDQGHPDPLYNPNTLFSPSTSDYAAEKIASSDLVYSFKKYDKNDTGKISVISPRTGKLWVSILDSDKISPGDGDADGKYIEFTDNNEDGIASVNGNNVLYTHGGYYTVKANIQVESENSIDQAISNDNTPSGANKLLTSYIIKPIKTIFVGDYLCKRCLINNPSKCEIKPDNIKEEDWYTANYKKVCDYDWSAGMLGKIASSFLKIHLLYVAWFIFVVFSVFIIGFQFITGEQKFDFNFMKKYLWRYALIMAFVNPQSLELYIKLFVKPAFNLAEGLSAFVAGSFSSEKYTALNPQDFIYSAFGPIDKILKFWINQYTFEKLLAILFSSWSGIIVIIILIMCFVFFIINVIEAVILYIVILIKMSLYLAIGPIVFLLLIHEKTSDKFSNWLKTIAACIAEQVMMFTGLSFFGTIYYYIIKGSMNFVYCWEPIIKIPILDITLFSMWRISGTMPVHMAELSGHVADEVAFNTKGFNFLTAFILFIITCMMSEFVDKTSIFGAKLFGQQSSMPNEIKKALGQVKTIVSNLPSKGVKAIKNIGPSSSSSSKKNDNEKRGT